MCRPNLKCVFLCRRCWLSVDNHFIWSFIGPVTFIIMVSCFIFFFEYCDWQSEEGTERGRWRRCRREIKEVRWLNPRKSQQDFSSESPERWQVNFAAKRDLEASFNSLLSPGWQGSGFDNVLFTHLHNSHKVSRCRHCQMAFRFTVFMIKGGKKIKNGLKAQFYSTYSKMARQGFTAPFFLLCICLLVCLSACSK